MFAGQWDSGTGDKLGPCGKLSRISRSFAISAATVTVRAVGLGHGTVRVTLLTLEM